MCHIINIIQQCSHIPGECNIPLGGVGYSKVYLISTDYINKLFKQVEVFSPIAKVLPIETIGVTMIHGIAWAIEVARLIWVSHRPTGKRGKVNLVAVAT
jgi:hypothetical protein